MSPPDQEGESGHNHTHDMTPSYHVRTNMSVRRGIFEALAYKVYIRKRYKFFLVCTFKNGINFFKVEVDVQKGP